MVMRPNGIGVLLQEVDIRLPRRFRKVGRPIDHEIDIPGKDALELLLIGIAGIRFAGLVQNAIAVSEVRDGSQREGVGLFVVGVIP